MMTRVASEISCPRRGILHGMGKKAPANKSFGEEMGSGEPGRTEEAYALRGQRSEVRVQGRPSALIDTRVIYSGPCAPGSGAASEPAGCVTSTSSVEGALI